MGVEEHFVRSHPRETFGREIRVKDEESFCEVMTTVNKSTSLESERTKIVDITEDIIDANEVECEEKRDIEALTKDIIKIKVKQVDTVKPMLKAIGVMETILKNSNDLLKFDEQIVTGNSILMKRLIGTDCQLVVAIKKYFEVSVEIRKSETNVENQFVKVAGSKENVAKAIEIIEEIRQGILPTFLFEDSVTMNINRLQFRLFCLNGGAELARLRKLSIIHIIKETDTITCMGSKKNVGLVVKEIEKLFSDIRYLMFPFKASDLLLANIETIRKKTQIKSSHIFQAQTGASERKVGFAGTRTQMEAACGMIEELMKRFK